MNRNPELPAPTPDIVELRAAMSRVRAAQEVGGLGINLARYDAETDAINHDFLTSFLDILPVEPDYRGNFPHDRVAKRFILDDPLNVRVASSYGLIINSVSESVALLIGEKTQYVGRTALTQVLTVGWERATDDTGYWQPVAPRVSEIRVLSENWNKLRDQAINRLGQPYSKEQLMSVYSSELNAFCLSDKARLETPVINAYLNQDMVSVVPRIMWRSALKGDRSDRKQGTIRGIAPKVRNLMSTDFEEFNVMLHLEYLAAAFGVGDAFDDVKATREAKMPKHPAEDMFGLPNYRQVVENGASVEPPALA